VDYEGDVTALWRDLLKGKFNNKFPEDMMKAYSFDLNTVIRRIGDR
jgi:hypothetical protein